MQCPLCGDEALHPHIRLGIEIDVCPRCKGVWLDRGELDRLVAEPPARDADLARYAPAPAAPGHASLPQPDDRDGRRDRDHGQDRGDDRDRDRDGDRDRRPKEKKKQKKRKPKSKRLSDALEDLFDDILDF